MNFKKYLKRKRLDTVKSLIEDDELYRLSKLPRYIPTETVLFGNQLKVSDTTTYLSSLKEIFGQEIYKFEIDKKDVCIIDCGANIGLATIYFKNKFPKAKIISYEPDPKIFNILKENLQSFGYPDVEAVNAAISNKEGFINFHMEGGHSGMITNESGQNIISVRSIRLKNVLEQFEEIDFLKIDIEGHETDVLPDIAKELKKVKFLFLEYHSFINKNQQLDNLLLLVKDAGLKYYIKEAINKSHPFINREIFLGMDLLVNIFCYRDE